MRYPKLIAALFATVAIVACNKSNSSQENKPALNDLENKLVGRWQFIKSVDSVTNVDGSTKSVTDETQDCERDDIYTFRADKKYIIDFGTKSCSPYEQSVETMWSIRPDSNFDFDRISIISDANPTVVRLDNEYFVIRAHTKASQFNGVVSITNTYKRL